MKNIIATFFCVLSLLSLPASAQVAMGKWRTHLAYNNVAQLAQSDNKIYGVSDGALFSVDKHEGEGGMEFYSKLTGLNASNISRIEFDPTSKQLLIVYVNGNIDLLTSGGVINIPDLYNKQMSASKEVNQIQFYQNKAYLACNFGIIAINMLKKEIADTYYIGSGAAEVKVLATTVHNGTIYALTPNAIYQADVSEPNLVNYEFWSSITDLPGNGDLQRIGTFAGKLIVQRAGKLYVKNDTGWSGFLSEIIVNYFNVSNGKLLVNDGASAIYVVDETFNYKIISSVGSIPDAEYDPLNNTYWFAANELGIISYKQTGSEEPNLNYYKPEGPAVNIPWNMTFAGEKLFVVPGGRWSAQYIREGAVMIYEDKKWTNILGKQIQDKTGHTATDLMNVAVDPNDPKHFFVTSYGTGLYEFINDKFENWYNYTNSTIQGHPLVPNGPDNFSRLDGAIFDKQGNLFFCNSAVAASIKVYTKAGKWEQLTYPNGAQETLGTILINNQNTNQKWVLSVRGNCIIVFDDNGTIPDQSDDKSVTISAFSYMETDNSGQNTLVSKYSGAIYSIAQDKNGTIWVGTDIGPFLFNNPTNAFNPNYICSRVKIPRNDSTNLADYLLVNEKIKAIAIDGANRKWIGTESSGVYLMSENGQQTIQHFTAANSPLLSNDILSIAIQPKTGEVFFGTGQGIVSYQSDASEATDKFTNVYAYPNPVREGFNGVITITGLVENTQVKITDINGNLVCQTVSNGSIATWDGKDVHGRKVSSGIYLAMCSSEDGTQSAITKILVIN
ncbi:MAG: two-component regulator propeller domain-containing protein [Paludibacter sp.]